MTLCPTGDFLDRRSPATDVARAAPDPVDRPKRDKPSFGLVSGTFATCDDVALTQGDTVKVCTVDVRNVTGQPARLLLSASAEYRLCGDTNCDGTGTPMRHFTARLSAWSHPTGDVCRTERAATEIGQHGFPGPFRSGVALPWPQLRVTAGLVGAWTMGASGEPETIDLYSSYIVSDAGLSFPGTIRLHVTAFIAAVADGSSSDDHYIKPPLTADC